MVCAVLQQRRCCIAPWLSTGTLLWPHPGRAGLAAKRRGGTPGFWRIVLFTFNLHHLACRFLCRSPQFQSAACGLSNRLGHSSSARARKPSEKTLICNRLQSLILTGDFTSATHFAARRPLVDGGAPKEREERSQAGGCEGGLAWREGLGAPFQ